LLNEDLPARRDTNLAVDNYTLAGRYSVFNNDQISLPLAQRDGPLLGSRVLLHDVNERSLR
jgi:hypothetical protein